MDGATAYVLFYVRSIMVNVLGKELLPRKTENLFSGSYYLESNAYTPLFCHTLHPANKKGCGL